jgi:hypothetical protein
LLKIKEATGIENLSSQKWNECLGIVVYTVIPALGKLMLEDHEFKASTSHTTRSYHKKGGRGVNGHKEWFGF